MFDIRSVKASGTIYIRADGSIDPPVAPISTVDNITYAFTGNVYDSIAIERDNIIVDGAGYTVQGAGSGKGVDLSGKGNVTIKNTVVREFDFGIYLNRSESNTITGNFLTEINFEGIRLYESSNNNITENRITVNDCDGVTLYGSLHNRIAENNLTSNYDGIRLYESSNNVIVRNTVTNNYYGIFLAFSSNNSIVKNSITANYGNGISLVWISNQNKIAENLILTNNCGVYLNESSNDDIVENNITNNYYGVWFSFSSNDTISGNGITHNNYGVRSEWSSGNKFYHNNFINNDCQVYRSGVLFSPDFWDGGYPSGGNYWSDYNGTDFYGSCFQNETGKDGIGDSAYEVTFSSTIPKISLYDNYPLMGMFHSFNTSLGYNVNVVSNSTIEDFQYFESNTTIRIYVSNMTVNQTFGFCRLTIPHDLMTPPYNVVVNGNPVDCNTVFENETLSIIYFSYEHSTLEIIIVPEFPSNIILPMFLMLATIPSILAKKIRYKKAKT